MRFIFSQFKILIMKTLKSGLVCFVLVLSFLFSTQVAAYNVEDSNAGIKIELEKLVKNSNLVENGLGNQDISVSFRINEQNEIVVIGMKSDSKYLKKHIYDKLNNQTIDLENYEVNTTYKVKFKFELK